MLQIMISEKDGKFLVDNCKTACLHFAIRDEQDNICLTYDESEEERVNVILSCL